MKFTVRTKDNEGRATKFSLTADSREHAERRLAKRGFEVVEFLRAEGEHEFEADQDEVISNTETSQEIQKLLRRFGLWIARSIGVAFEWLAATAKLIESKLADSDGDRNDKSAFAETTATNPEAVKPEDGVNRWVAAGGCLVLLTLAAISVVILWGTMNFLGVSSNSNSGLAKLDPATHVVTEDVCIYAFPLGGWERDQDLMQLIFFQDLTPLYGSPRNTINRIRDDRALILDQGTGLTILKTQIHSGENFAETIHFARVSSGKHKGKEGWISDKFVRRNW